MKKSNRTLVSEVCALREDGKLVYPNVTAFFEAACKWQFGDDVTAGQLIQARNAAKEHLSGSEPRLDYVVAFAKTRHVPAIRAENKPRRLRPATFARA